MNESNEQDSEVANLDDQISRGVIQGDKACGEEMSFEKVMKSWVLNILRLRCLWDIHQVMSIRQEGFLNVVLKILQVLAIDTDVELARIQRQWNHACARDHPSELTDSEAGGRLRPEV